MIWQHENAQEIIEILNKFYPNIKFTADYLSEKVPLLISAKVLNK